MRKELIAPEDRGSSHREAEAGNHARAEAIRSGRLHDISAVARRCAGLKVPTAMTRKLWNVVGEGDPFKPEDRRLAEVCYALLYAQAGLAPSQRMKWGVARLLAFRCTLAGRAIGMQCVAHPVDHDELVTTVMKEDEDWIRPS